MSLVTKETVDAAVEGAKSIAKVTAGVSNELISEAINLFIVESLLHVLKFAAVFVVFFIIKKYLDVMTEVNKSKENVFKGLKTTALILSIVFFTGQSFPHIIEMSKALVAPKIFLMEKGTDLLRGK